MKFKLPDGLSALDTAAIDALLADALAEYAELTAIDELELTDEQIDDLEGLAAAVNTIQAESDTRTAAADERTARIAAARATLDAASVEPEAEAETEGDEDIVVPDDASEILEGESVTAAAGTRRKVVSRVARKVEPDAPVDEATDRPKNTIIASIDIAGFAAGTEITDLTKAATAVQARLKGFPTSKGSGERQDRYGVFSIKREIPAEFMLGDSVGENYATLMAAAQEKRLPGNSLVAAGGWCAPSETIYDLMAWETVDGILSLPEVGIKRGGINYTQGPDFSAIYSSIGFVQTEAEAEAATVKNIIDVECPDFSEVRLDAIGYGIRAGILTNVGYPELIRRYLEAGLVAHQHKVNARVISKIVTFLGTAVNATEYGSAVADTLNALELAAERLRYKYRLNIGATLEAFAPAWLRIVFRRDLAYRMGVENFLSITDAQVTAFFAIRGISIQWVYDWQDLAATGVATPTSAQVALYPAGAFVKGTTDVISLDAIYDSTDVKTNTYTAIFFEEGLLVANMFGGGTLVDIALDTHGRVGRADITSLTTGYPA
jgi:hypothetical protein